MREHEAGQTRSPWRWHPWFKRIFNAVTHVSAASLLAAGMASSLAARKHKGRNDDRGGRDDADRDRDGGNGRNREGKQDNEPKDDRNRHRDNRDRSDGDGHGGDRHRNGKQESQADDSSDVHSSARQSATPTPTPTGGDGGKGDGGGGKGDGDSGRGDGGGNDAGNAGSGFFDSPLATKARRRANDFDNADRDPDESRIVVDVNPEGESVYETDSILFATGPDGIEIETGNITYFAEPTPTPTPLPGLDLPVREPGFPFGEDFPFGDTTVVVAPPAPEPSDPGDTGTAPAPRAEPVPAADEPEPASSDGGDNTMDFSS